MIENYKFHSITIDGKVYSKDVIIYPEKVDSDWWRESSHNVGLKDIENTLNYKPEAIIFGTGNPGKMQVSEKVRSEIKKRGIELIIKPTKKACKILNKAHKNKKRAVGLFHLTC